MVSYLIEHNADINRPSNDGYTPFHFVILYKCHELAFSFINQEADLNYKTKYGYSAIHYTVETGCMPLFYELLSRQDSIEYITKDGNSLLLYAFIFNQKSIIDTLIRMGANVNRVNQYGESPLYYAIQYSDTTHFDLLLNKQANPNAGLNSGYSPIYMAASIPNYYFLEQLLIYGASYKKEYKQSDDYYYAGIITLAHGIVADTLDKVPKLNKSETLFELALDNYKRELNVIRAKNTGKTCLTILAGLSYAFTDVYYVPDENTLDYEDEKRRFLKDLMKQSNYYLTLIEEVKSCLNSNQTPCFTHY